MLKLNNKNKLLLIIGGPTAVGKTKVSIELAQKYKCPILSADSRQFYKEMRIGTARPSEEELAQADHHFIGHLSIQQAYSVGDFERDSTILLEKLFKKHQIVILTGGTGLYIKAVCEGLDYFPTVPSPIFEGLQKQLQSQGIESLQEELKIRDPLYFQKVDINNPHRLIRALSIIRVSDQPFSSFHNQPKPARAFTPMYIALQMERSKLYDRINQRVDQMMDDGLLEEARSLHPHQHLNSLNTVGYKEIFGYLDGKMTLEGAISKIKQHSRNYAKRQITWLKNQGVGQEINSDDINSIFALVNSKID